MSIHIRCILQLSVLSCFFSYLQAAQDPLHFSQFGLTIGRDDNSVEDVEIFDLDINPSLGNIISLGSIRSSSVKDMIIMQFGMAGMLECSLSANVDLTASLPTLNFFPRKIKVTNNK